VARGDASNTHVGEVKSGSPRDCAGYASEGSGHKNPKKYMTKGLKERKGVMYGRGAVGEK